MRSISSSSALLEFQAEVERLDVGGVGRVSGRPNRAGRATLLGTAQPGLWGSLLFVTAGRTRSGTALGTFRSATPLLLHARGDYDAGVLRLFPSYLLWISTLGWRSFLPANPSCEARSRLPQDSSMHSVDQRQENRCQRLGNPQLFAPGRLNDRPNSFDPVSRSRGRPKPGHARCRWFLCGRRRVWGED